MDGKQIFLKFNNLTVKNKPHIWFCRRQRKSSFSQNKSSGGCVKYIIDAIYSRISLIYVFVLFSHRVTDIVFGFDIIPPT